MTTTITDAERVKINKFVSKVILDVIFNQKSCIKCNYEFETLDEYSEMAYDEIAELIDEQRGYNSDSFDIMDGHCLKICDDIFPMLSRQDRVSTAEKLWNCLYDIMQFDEPNLE